MANPDRDTVYTNDGTTRTTVPPLIRDTLWPPGDAGT